MRGAIHFVAIVVISVALVVGAAFLAGVSPVVAGLAFALGIAVTIGASIYVNTRNANRYGRQVWEDQGGMDGVPRHASHMRRDRVVRHAEGPATFPAGDVA
jgi:hypothetical protein